MSFLVSPLSSRTFLFLTRKPLFANLNNTLTFVRCFLMNALFIIILYYRVWLSNSSLTALSFSFFFPWHFWFFLSYSTPSSSSPYFSRYCVPFLTPAFYRPFSLLHSFLYLLLQSVSLYRLNSFLPSSVIPCLGASDVLAGVGLS